MTSGNGSAREMLATLVRALVDEPGAVEVEEVSRNQTTVLELRVAPGDLGKVIGREGRTARALRAILATAGEKIGQRVVLQILE